MAPSTAPAVLVATLLLSAGLTVPAAATATSTETKTIRVTGTWLVAGEGHDEPEYAIAVDDDLVPVTWSGTAVPPEPASRVTAELLLPAAVASSVPDGTLLRAGTVRGDRTLALIDDRADTLLVDKVLRVAEAQDADPAPLTHQVYVAAPDNLGDFVLSDYHMLGMVDEAAVYWEDEADGLIADMVVPDQVVTYTAEVATEANKCGLDADFFAVVEEAAAEFPEADFHGGTDLLVVLAPSDCESDSTRGRASLGTGLAGGGVQVATVSDDRFSVGTLAHEWGHNFGLTHSNLGPCDDLACPGEYLNLYNIMGRGISWDDNRLTALSTGYRSIAGVLAPDEVADVPLPEPGGASTSTFTLAPRSEKAGLRAVRVVDPDDGDHVFVEYRSGTEQDALSAYARNAPYQGLQFRPGVVLESVDQSSTWLRLHAGFSAMIDGQEWSNGSGTLTIAVDEVTAETATVTVVATTAPTPIVTGEAQVGRTLTADVGAWPNGTTLQFQWLAAGTAIPGATGTGYVPGADVVGRRLSFQVTASHPSYRTMVRTSSATPKVRKGLLVAGRPVVSGKPRVGKELTAAPGRWTPSATLRYAWRADGKVIRGVTARKLVLRSVHRGKRISVRVTGSRPGYANRSVTSASTRPVRR